MSEPQSIKPHKFFELDLTYQIQPGGTMQAMASDAKCLLQSGLDTLEGQCEEGDKIPGWWAALYLLRQGMAVFDVLQSRIDQAKGREM